MSSVSELSVVVKTEDKRLVKKFLLYDLYQVSQDDLVVKKCIDNTIEDFGEMPDDIKVKINLEVK